MLIPMEMQTRTTNGSPQVEALKRVQGLASRLDGKPHLEIHIGDRQLLGIKDLIGVTVACDGSVAEVRFGKGAKSIAGMKHGLTAMVDGQQVRIWRPHFGFLLRSRVLQMEGTGTAWSIVPEGLQKYRVLDQAGTVLLRRDRRKVLVEGGLPNDKLSLLMLVHITGVVLTSSLLWYFIQGL